MKPSDSSDPANIDALWDYDHPADTEQKFRSLIPVIEAKGEAGRMVELLTQIARTQGLQRRFDEAYRTLDEAERVLAGRSGRPRVRLLLERGRALNSSKQPDEARPLFIEAWDLAREIGEDGLAVDAAHMVAIGEDGDEVLRWNLLALDFATNSPDPAARKWRKSLHNNIGWSYFDRRDYTMALSQFEKTKECAIENGDTVAERIAWWSIAKTKRLLGRFEEAMEIQSQLLADSEAAHRDAGFQHEEMAECLLALGRTDEAKPYFGRAHESLSKDAWLADREPKRIQRLRDLA